MNGAAESTGCSAQPGTGSTGSSRPSEIQPKARLTPWTISVGLFVLALLPRLFVALSWARDPVWDGQFYDLGARHIAAGLGYSGQLLVGGETLWQPWSHYPVGYPALLAIVYLIVGSGPAVAPAFNALLSAALPVAVYRLARFATGEWRARLAGLLTAVHPGLIAYSVTVMTEPVASLALLLAGWAMVAGRNSARPSHQVGLLAGSILGLGVLVRPQSILVAPALGFLATAGRRRPNQRRKILRSGLFATIVALAVVTPWNLRNCLVMDGCAFVSTNAGWNLAIGALPRATGRYVRLTRSDGCYESAEQVRQDRCWMSQAVGWISADPERWLRLVPRKLSETFDHESFAMGYMGTADPQSWPPETQRDGRQILSLFHRLLLCLAAFGLVAWPNRKKRPQQLVALLGIGGLIGYGTFAASHPFWPLAVLIPLLAALRLPGAPSNRGVIAYLAWVIASTCLVHAAFFGEDRYHMVVSPLLCLLAACALRRPTDRPAVGTMGR